jgi:hypothetical protein
VRGPGLPAIATLVTLVVIVASLIGVVDVPPDAYAGLIFMLLGLAFLAWGREGL